MADPIAVVLVSGGLDSAVALAVARTDGYRCVALSFDYGQRHRVELGCAAAVARALGAAEHVVVKVDLGAIGGSALTDGAIAVPKDGAASDRGGAGDIPVTYVPARNLVFLSVAAGLAETRGCADLFIGANEMDYSGYPDCREPFLRAFEKAATLGTKFGTEAGGRGGFKVHAPLLALTKAQIIRLGMELGVDLSLTSSCYDPDAEGRACGRCDSCRIRRRGFAEAGVADPTRYAHGGSAAEDAERGKR